jgi:hypothetical protein
MSCRIIFSESENPMKSALWDTIYKYVSEEGIILLPKELREELSNIRTLDSSEDIADALYDMFSSKEVLKKNGDWLSAAYNFNKWGSLTDEIKQYIYDEQISKSKLTSKDYNDINKELGLNITNKVANQTISFKNLFKVINDNGNEVQKKLLGLIEKDFSNNDEPLPVFKFKSFITNNSGIIPLGIYEQKGQQKIIKIDPLLISSNARDKESFYDKFIEVALHEIMHYYTIESVHSFKTFNKEINSFTDQAILYNELTNQIENTPIGKLDDLFNYIKSNHPELSNVYGLSNLDEFISEVMSNSKFQYELSKIPYEYDNSNLTLLEEFWEALKSMLMSKFSIDANNTVLQEAISIVSLIIEESPNYSLKDITREKIKKDNNLTNLDYDYNLEPEFTKHNIDSLLKEEVINYKLKVVYALLKLSNNRTNIRLNSKEQPYIEINLRKTLNGQGVTNQQIDLIFDYMKSNNIKEISIKDLALEMAASYSFNVEINIAKVSENIKSINEIEPGLWNFRGEDFYSYSDAIEAKNQYNRNRKETPTSYYSNSTVPGGTNYTENEIATPNTQVQQFPKGITVKQGVEELFESNPELANIGTQEQYSQYLDTIFPDSKVKDIVYHGTDTRFESFDKNKISSKESTAHAKGFYFGWAGKFGAAASYAGNFGRGKEKVLLANTVQIQNPFILNGSFAPIKENQQFVDFLIRNGFDITKWKHYPKGDIFDYTTSVGTDKITEALKREGYDSIIVNKGGWKTIKRNVELGDVQANSDELIVFEPEQIHILGSKQDIEGFKKWKKDNTKTVIKSGIVPSIKGHAQFSTDNGLMWSRTDEKVQYQEQDIDNLLKIMENSKILQIKCS